MLPDKLAFVDIETTGTRAPYDRIIEIGIIRVENNEIVKTYQTLIDPQAHLPSEIELLTGITAKDLERAPTFREVAPDILEILQDCFFVAHNVRFDYSFLKHEFRRHAIDYSSKHFCTVKLSRSLFPRHKHHNLDSLIERFKIACKKRHRALDDAQVLFDFYTKIQSLFPLETIAKAISIGLRRPTIPLSLNLADLEKLPELPGVYIFYGDDGAPLYIGKSINIRHRVLSHFSGDVHSPLEMKISQQIKSIETITTAGELGALFLEADLIKKRMPLYNRKLRIKRQLIAVKGKEDKDGYQRACVETINNEELATATSHSGESCLAGRLQNQIQDGFWTSSPRFGEAGQNDGTCSICEENGQFLGFFRSSRQAKDFLYEIAKEHSLCERFLGLEKTKGACFGYRLGRCKGACVGKENPLFYNLRFSAAFYKTKISSWPFPGPILIEERDALREKVEYLVIDKWCYLGSVLKDAEGNTNPKILSYSFDLDMYKILRQYLNSPKNLKRIKLLNRDILDTFGDERLRGSYRNSVTLNGKR